MKSYGSFKIFKITAPSPRGQWVNSLRPSDAYMCQQSSHHWFRLWLVAWSAPSHYLNQCWNIVNWTIGNQLQWNFYLNSNIFIHENAFESVVCEMAVFLSRPQCVNVHIGEHLITANQRLGGGEAKAVAAYWLAQLRSWREAILGAN